MHDLPEKPSKPVEQAAEGVLLLLLLAAARAEGRPVYFLLHPFIANEGALLREPFRYLKKRFRMEEAGMPALRRIVPKPSRPTPERNRRSSAPRRAAGKARRRDSCTS